MHLRPIEIYSTEIEIKKSRFIGFGFPINSVDEARDILKKLKVEYADSRHICYGFLYGENSTHMGMSDDGEPSGTAGRPILEVLKGSEYENILVAVIRYFGGTKLGTGGLVKAYTEITQLVVKNINTEPYIQREDVSLSINYSQYNQIKALIEEFEFPIIEEIFETDIIIKFKISKKEKNSFNNKIMDLSNGKLFL